MTKQKRLKEALSINKARFKNIGIGIYDSDGNLVHVNQVYINIFGFINAVEISRFNLFNALNLPLDAKEKLSRGEVTEYESSFDFNKIKELGLYHTSRFGIIYLQVIISPLFLEKSKILQNYLVQVQDITERKLMEKKLQESEKKYRELIKYAPAGIYEVDFRNKRFLSVNDVMCEISGYSREELLEMSPFDVLDDQSKVIFQARINQWLNGEKPDENVEYKVKTKDGREIYVTLKVTFTSDENGKPFGATVISHDITKSKKAEDALRESQGKYQALIETTGDFIWEMDSSGRYTYCSPQMERLWGLEPEEMIGKTPFEMMLDDERISITEYFLQVLNSPVPFNGLVTTAYDGQGRLIFVETNGVPFFGNDGELLGFRGISRDITERKQAEEALRQSEQLYRTLFENTEDAFQIIEPLYDESGEICNFRFLEVNSKYEQQTGLKANDVIGKKVTDFLPDIEPYWIEMYDQVLKIGKPVRYENYNGGTKRWYNMFCFPYGKGQIGVLFKDITKRKQAEEQLKEGQELLRVTLNSLGEGVVAVDRGERIMLVNKAAVSMLRYPKDQLIGEPFQNIFYIIDHKTGEPITFNKYYKFIKPILVTWDSHEIPVIITSSPIKNSDDEMIGTVIVFQDISEAQKIELELQKQNKLESLGVLAGGIAHDFNNILASILSNIQLALIKQEKGEDSKKNLLHTIEISRKASDLTKQLLTFSRGGAPVRKDASINELIVDTAKFVLRGTNLKVEISIPDDLWAASIDESQISQVIHNLVLNAKQAMPKGGIINIIAENTLIGNHLQLKSGKYIKIMVQDYGIGIPKENLLKIFDPFFTTKKDGNGLGLATSYSIIKQHDGYLEVESQEKVGTIFSIYLPALEKSIIKSGLPPEEVVIKDSLKILLMDDEVQILNAVGEMLTCDGHSVTLVKNGAEAIQIYQQAKSSGEPFDVVIMDLTIPGGMGGQEAIAYLRDIDPEIKAIVSSGYANDPIMSDYKKFGFGGVVIKPYKIDELNEVIQKVISKEKL